MGCSAVDFNNCVPDWPPLRVTEHFVTAPEMREACSKYADPLSIILACTEWDFDEARVDSWYVDPAEEYLLNHERGHQRGCDHYNSTYMRDHWEEWKREHIQKYRPNS